MTVEVPDTAADLAEALRVLAEEEAELAGLEAHVATLDLLVERERARRASGQTSSRAATLVAQKQLAEGQEDAEVARIRVRDAQRAVEVARAVAARAAWAAGRERERVDAAARAEARAAGRAEARRILADVARLPELDADIGRQAAAKEMLRLAAIVFNNLYGPYAAKGG